MDQIIEKIKQIKKKISSGLPDAKVIVLPNSIRGINLKVVYDDFPNDYDRREDMINQLLKDLNLRVDDELFQFVELLTTEEDRIFGVDLSDIKPEDLPFWENKVTSNIVSNDLSVFEPLTFRGVDKDETDEYPIVVTFYSFKGGVGRSTALASTAYLLAKEGKKVLILDMDFEAPSLDKLFNVGEMDQYHKAGLVEIIRKIENEDKEMDLTRYMIPIDDNILLIPAGQISPYYIYGLSQIDLKRYYRFERNPLRELFDMLKELRFEPDFILVDSRTGISNISAPLLLDLSDMAVIFFYPHPQAKDGTDLLVNSILASKNRRSFTNELRFVLSPLPPSDMQTNFIYNLGKEWIINYVDKINSIRNFHKQEKLDLKYDDIFTSIYYNEQMAFRTSISNDEQVIQPYRRIAEWIDALSNKKELDKFPNKPELLETIKIETGIAEDQDNLKEFYVKTKDYKKSLSDDIVLIIGRKGAGKTALFKILEAERKSQSITLRPPKPEDDPYFLSKDALLEIEKHLKESNWELYWGIITIFKLIDYTQISMDKFYVNNIIQEYLRLKNCNTEIEFKSQLVKSILELIKKPVLSTEIYTCLNTIVGYINFSKLYLLCDGLDRGFGEEIKQEQRRDKIIIGLFDFMNTASSLFDNLKFKIFLRYDIWDRLKFQNKSHFYGRTTRLSWQEKNEYYKTLLKQVYRNQAKEALDYLYMQINKDKLPEEVDDWDENQIYNVLGLLVGERMKGGKSAYTKNWIWTRLADGNSEHSPRYLFQLFREALEFEKEEYRKNPYERSLIRPRALINALKTVSEQAVSALINEEYKELSILKDYLNGKVLPIKLSEFPEKIKPEIINLGLNVGLLVPYEKDERGEIVRITVPDLYLSGLGTSRRGQA